MYRPMNVKSTNTGIEIRKLAAAKSPHWVYVVDYAYNNEIDSRVWLFDGDTHRRIGQIDTGFTPG